ncbi:MAG: aminomethyltransferase family protein [Anaerolineales bacterium]|nr:aminomethyltransferase family protein [Anaerolineales bacterium]
MPLPTPFHTRTAPLCESHSWRDWSGYLSPSMYELSFEREYWAIRNAAGVIDISPLFKYDIIGPDAEAMLNRTVTRDMRRCRVGQVFYTPWCDETGDMRHDGNIIRIAADHFRVTTADPMLRWFEDCGYGMDVTITDVSTRYAALALQGPNSRAILKQLTANLDLDTLRYFRMGMGIINELEVMITRTGFTGDLGYELWVEAQHAEALWDSLMRVGRAYGLLPFGLTVLDMVRVEAGLLLIEVDYISSNHAVIDGQKSNPLEAGLGWAVNFDKGEFIGRKPLLADQERGPEWQFVGLEVDWAELERLWATVDLRPKVVYRTTSRESVPVYRGGTNGRLQIGQATSHLFSPLLKKYIALATLKTPDATIGSEVDLEMTVEYSRVLAKAQVVQLPFFNPSRKRE